jgi:hypothetical protein
MMSVKGVPGLLVVCGVMHQWVKAYNGRRATLREVAQGARRVMSVERDTCGEMYFMFTCI